ncbi:unnamed protein product [Lampetra planeri]
MSRAAAHTCGVGGTSGASASAGTQDALSPTAHCRSPARAWVTIPFEGACAHAMLTLGVPSSPSRHGAFCPRDPVARPRLQLAKRSNGVAQYENTNVKPGRKLHAVDRAAVALHNSERGCGHSATAPAAVVGTQAMAISAVEHQRERLAGTAVQFLTKTAKAVGAEENAQRRRVPATHAGK